MEMCYRSGGWETQDQVYRWPPPVAFHMAEGGEEALSDSFDKDVHSSHEDFVS